MHFVNLFYNFEILDSMVQKMFQEQYKNIIKSIGQEGNFVKSSDEFLLTRGKEFFSEFPIYE